jgi:hypothetical protein
MVSGVVTRSPAVNVLSMPSLPRCSLICVHHHRAQARVPQEHDVLREREAQVLVGHGVPAELDHDGFAMEAFQPRQRLDQRRGFGQRALRSFLLGCGFLLRCGVHHPAQVE